MECEAILHVSVKVDSSLAGSMLDETLSLAKYDRIISTPDGKTAHADSNANTVFDEVWVAFKLVVICKLKMKNLISLLLYSSIYKTFVLIF